MQGVPTVTLITTSFVKLARFPCSAAGMPDQSFVILPHPIGGIAADDLRTKVRAAAGDLWRQLTAWRPAEGAKSAGEAPPYPSPVIRLTGSVSDVQSYF